MFASGCGSLTNYLNYNPSFYLMCGFFVNDTLTFGNLFINLRIFQPEHDKNNTETKAERTHNMKNKNKNHSKVIKFLNGKAFYVILSVCFIAVGMAAWSGVKSIKDMNEILGSEQSHPDSTISIPKSSTTSDTANTDNSQTEGTPSVSSKPSENKPSENKPSSETDTPNSDKTEETAGNVAAFFIKPVLGDILKDFSDTELKYSLTFRDMRLHKAVDIKADKGTPVVASGDGTVIDVKTDSLLGTLVEIDHGNGITAKYCGLNAKPPVKVGDSVTSGTQIGAIDVIPCESVEESHLHIEFYLNGKAVSPLKYFTE